MNNALYIDENNIPEINQLKTFVDTTTTTIISDLNDVLKLSGIKTLGLLYTNRLYNCVPFMIQEYSINRKYVWYSDKLVSYFKQLKQYGVERIFLITCNLNNPTFINETKKLSNEIGIKIEYSLDQTGNGIDADWILESNNTNMIGIMFKTDVIAWKHSLESVQTLTTPTEILSFFNNSGAVLPKGSLIYQNGQYKLTHDVEIRMILNPDDGYILTRIQLNNGEIFDGCHNQITIIYPVDGFFVINSSSLSTTICNLKYNFGFGDMLLYYVGSIVASYMDHFTVDHCSLLCCTVSQYAGSICSDHCSNFVIKNCVNHCDNPIYSLYGGICNSYCYDGIIKNCDNYAPIGGFYIGSTDPAEGTIYGDLSGGIIGPYSQNIKIIKCNNYGHIFGINSGGIAGGFFGYELYWKNYDDEQIVTNLVFSCHSIIDKCTNYGQIYGQNSGGIVGGYLGMIYGQLYGSPRSNKITIKKCVNKGKIMGSQIGGICGSLCGLVFYVFGDYTSTDVWDPKYTYKTNEKIEFIKCYTKYGSIISTNCSYLVWSNTPFKFEGPNIYVIRSYSKEKARVVSSFYFLAGSGKAQYIGEHKHKHVNLLKHPTYIAQK